MNNTLRMLADQTARKARAAGSTDDFWSSLTDDEYDAAIALADAR